jgi:hypothetical protein
MLHRCYYFLRGILVCRFVIQFKTIVRQFLVIVVTFLQIAEMLRSIGVVFHQRQSVSKRPLGGFAFSIAKRARDRPRFRPVIATFLYAVRQMRSFHRPYLRDTLITYSNSLL